MSETKHTPVKLEILEGFGQEDHIDPRYYIGSSELPQAVFVTSGGNDKANAERLVLCWNSHDAALAEAVKVEEDNDAQKKSLEAWAIALNTQVAEIEQLQAKLDAISDLCENCTTLGDAQYIASGQGKTSTDDGCDKCMVDEKDKIIEQLQTKLAALRWIPVSEGLPGEGIVVLVKMESGYMGKCEIINGEWQSDEDIIACWMPVPTLPDDEEAEK